MSPRARSLLVSVLLLAIILPVPARAFFDLGGFDFGSFDIGGMTSGFVDTATGGQAIGRLFEGAIPLLGVGLVVGGIVQGLEGGGGGSGGGGSATTDQFGQNNLIGGANNPYLGPVLERLEQQARLEQARTQVQAGTIAGPQNDPYAGLPAYQSPQNYVAPAVNPNFLPPIAKSSADTSFFYTPPVSSLPLDAREKPVEAAVEQDIPNKQAPSAGTKAISVTPVDTSPQIAPTTVKEVPTALIRTSTEAPAKQSSTVSGDGSLRIAYGTDVLVLPRAQLEEDAAQVTEEPPSTKEPGTVSRAIQKTAFYFGKIIGSALDGIAGTQSNDASHVEQPLNTSQPPPAVEPRNEIERAAASIMQEAPPMEPKLHAECKRLVAAMMIVYGLDPKSVEAGEYAAAQALVRAYEEGQYAFLNEECRGAVEKARVLPEIWRMGDAGTSGMGVHTDVLERTTVELTAEKIAPPAPVLIPPPNTVTECVGTTCVKRPSEVPFPSAEGTVRRGINGLYAWITGFVADLKKTPEPPPPPPPPPPEPKLFVPTLPETLSECQDIARSRWMLRFVEGGAKVPADLIAQHRARLYSVPFEKVKECVTDENVCQAAVFNLILLREAREGRLTFPGELQENFIWNLEEANQYYIRECRRNSADPPKVRLWGLRPINGY